MINKQSYVYKARRLDGKPIEGVLECLSIDDLEQTLSERGLFLEKAKAKSSKKKDLSFTSAKALRARWLHSFNKDLSSLIASGMTIDQAIDTISQLADNFDFQNICQGIHKKLQQGQTLATALKDPSKDKPNPKWPFNTSYIAAIEASEQSGELAQVLKDLDTMLSLERSVRSKWQKALIYPIFLGFMLCGILLLMFTFVIPRFASLYEDLNAPLPLLTHIILDIHHNFLFYLIAITAACISPFIIKSIALEVSPKRASLFFSNLKLKIPVYGKLVEQRNQLETLFVLSSLVDAGIPLQKALHILNHTSLEARYNQKLEIAAYMIKDGISAKQALIETRLFDQRRLAIINTGLAANDLSGRLKFAAIDLQEEFEIKVDKLTVLAEPLMLLIVGLVVGTVLIAVYMPIFGLSALVG